MPSEIYRERVNGDLVWSWEQGYGQTPLGVKIKKTRYLCEFCRKDISKRIYKIQTKEILFRVFSGCQFLYKIFRKEKDAGNLKIVENIIQTIIEEGQHCRKCISYNRDYPSTCNRHYYTGVGGRHNADYPRSFANHGCVDYRERN